MILRVANWNEVRRSQVALGIVLLTQALLIFFLARPEDASHIYEKAGAYLFAIGPFDAANDSNFDRLAQVVDKATASKVVNHRILVTNLMLLFSTVNLIFCPFYRNFLNGGHLSEQSDHRAHMLYFSVIFFVGLALFCHVNLNGDFLFIGVTTPNYSGYSLDANWWMGYGISQSVIIFWSGMLISILVAVTRSLLGSLRIYDGDLG